LAIMNGILRETWGILNESAPWVLLGFLIAAILKAFLPDSLVKKHLGGNGSGWAVVKAALLGIPIPLCSCGVVPAAMGLREQGASRGATTSFLISTPETGVDSIAISWALLDPIMTVFRPLAAFVTAMVAGWFENIFDGKNPDVATTENSASDGGCGCHDGCTVEGTDSEVKPGIRERIQASLKFAFVELLGDIGLWLLVGIILAGVVAYAVPEEFLSGWLGGGLVSYLIMLVAGIPIYICATSSTPLAAALILKGLSPGAALVFLIAGPATNMATMTVVYKFMGRRSLMIYLISISACAVGFGWFLDYIYNAFNISMIPAIGNGDCECITWFSVVTSVVLLGLIVWSVAHSFLAKRKG